MTADERHILVRRKIERADKHIDDLKAAIVAFGNSNPYKVATKRNPNTRQLIYYLASVDDTPASVSAITGDILNNLRCALDHVAQQLYSVGTGERAGHGEKTSFPISSSAGHFRDGFSGKVRGMRQDAIDEICALEPYGGGKGADLWTLNQLNNIDKHRLIVTVSGSFHSMNLAPIFAEIHGLPPGVNFPEFFIKPADALIPLKTDDELFISAPDAEPNQNIPFDFQIVIHEPGVIEGKSILETVAQFRDRVSSIIDTFKPYLA